MKSLTLLISFLWLNQVLFAQAVTIDNVPVPVQYYRMPDEPLDPAFTTYSSDIEARFGGLSSTGYTETSLIDEFLYLSGYKKVNREGDIEIEASIGDFNVFGERMISNKTKHKDKDGKETTKYTYAKEIKYSLPISLKVADKNGNTLEDEYIFSWSDEKTYTTTYYNSINDLDNHWRSNRTIKLQELQRNMVREGFGTMANIINNKYGYRLMKENTKFEMIGKKKHPKYQEYEEALETIKSAFTSMSADKGLSDIKTKIKPSLDFYNAEGIACKTKTKDDVKLKHINLYNQALAYYWVEDFEQATQYAKEILKFSNKDKDAKKLLENIEYAQSSLEHANKTSRHGTMVGGKA